MTASPPARPRRGRYRCGGSAPPRWWRVPARRGPGRGGRRRWDRGRCRSPCGGRPPGLPRRRPAAPARESSCAHPDHGLQRPDQRAVTSCRADSWHCVRERSCVATMPLDRVACRQVERPSSLPAGGVLRCLTAGRRCNCGPTPALAASHEDVGVGIAADERECGHGMGWSWSSTTVVAVLEIPIPTSPCRTRHLEQLVRRAGPPLSSRDTMVYKPWPPIPSGATRALRLPGGPAATRRTRYRIAGCSTRH